MSRIPAGSAATAYAPFTDFEMQRVRQVMDRMQGTWLLTCDDSPECRRVFQGLPMIEMSIQYSIGSRKQGAPRQTSGEMLIVHPSLAARHQGCKCIA